MSHHPVVHPNDALVRSLEAVPSSPVSILAMGPGTHARWTARVAERGGAFVRVLAYDALVFSLEDQLLLPNRPEVDAADRVALLLDLARRYPQLAASIAPDPQRVAFILTDILDNLARHGLHRFSPGEIVVPEGPGARVVRVHLELLHRLLADFRSAIAVRGLDEISRLERVITAVLEAPYLPRRTLVVDGWHLLTPLQQALIDGLEHRGASIMRVQRTPEVHAAGDTLLAALQAGAPGTVEAAPDSSFVRVECRDMFEEAEAVAEEVLARVAAGVAPGDIALQAPGGEGYADLLARVFAAHGLSLAAADLVPAARTPLYQAFRAFVRLWWSGPDPFDLVTVLSAAGSGVIGGRRDRLAIALLDAMPGTWVDVRRVIDRVTIAATGRDGNDAEVDPARVERESEAREAAQGIVTILARGPGGRRDGRELDPLQASDVLRQAVAWFTNGIGSEHRMVTTTLGDREAMPHRDVARAIRRAATLLVTRACEDGRPLLEHFSDAGAFLQALEPLLPQVGDPVSDGAIALRLGDTCGPPVDHLLVVGFSRGRWPTPVSYPPLLGELEREALREFGKGMAVLTGGGLSLAAGITAAGSVAGGLAALGARGAGLAALPLAVDMAVQNAERARAVLGQARRSLTVFIPARNGSGGGAPPALILVDLLKRFTPPALARWQASSGRSGVPVPPVRGEEGAVMQVTAQSALRRVARELGASRPLSPSARAWLSALASAGLTGPLASPWRPAHHFQVPVDLDLKTFHFSATSLEALLTCRYRFHVHYLLRLGSLNLARRPDLSVRELGELTHKVLEVLGDGLYTATGEDVTAAFQQVIDDGYPWANDLRYRLALARARTMLQAFVPAYQAMLAQLGYRSGRSEVRFGGKKGPPVSFPLDGSLTSALERLGVDRIQLVGAVDRLELAGPGSPRALTLDFKLGNTAKFQSMRTVGLGLQAALYPLAARTLEPHDGLGFAYVSLDRRRGHFLPARGAVLPDDLGSLEVDAGDDIEAFQGRVTGLLTERLAALVGDSRQGGLGDVSPHSAKAAEQIADAKGKSCQTCGAGLLCRYQYGGMGEGTAL